MKGKSVGNQSTLQQGRPAVIIDVNERTFQSEVLERSKSMPVIVDFWAPWCGPCRTLGPILERLTEAGNGAFILAKVNVDQNQRLAVAYRVQGIPAVKAFRDGRVVDEFSGMLPESQVRDWLRRVIPATADRLVEEAIALEGIDQQAAIARYHAALEHDNAHAVALFGLGRLLLRTGNLDGIEALKAIPASSPFNPRAQILIEMVSFFIDPLMVDETSLEQRIAHDATDHAARYDLAAHLSRKGEQTAAMDQLLAIIQRDRSFRDDGARRTLLALFEMIGDTPLVGQYRRKLANTLF